MRQQKHRNKREITKELLHPKQGLEAVKKIEEAVKFNPVPFQSVWRQQRDREAKSRYHNPYIMKRGLEAVKGQKRKEQVN